MDTHMVVGVHVWTHIRCFVNVIYFTLKWLFQITTIGQISDLCKSGFFEIGRHW